MLQEISKWHLVERLLKPPRNFVIQAKLGLVSNLPFEVWAVNTCNIQYGNNSMALATGQFIEAEQPQKAKAKNQPSSNLSPNEVRCKLGRA